ncbi:hypothetical protein RFI_27553, partial [Reticulomyxa filosa]
MAQKEVKRLSQSNSSMNLCPRQAGSKESAVNENTCSCGQSSVALTAKRETKENASAMETNALSITSSETSNVNGAQIRHAKEENVLAQNQGGIHSELDISLTRSNNTGDSKIDDDISGDALTADQGQCSNVSMKELITEMASDIGKEIRRQSFFATNNLPPPSFEN